ncbi:hypothetical protein C8J57DRAFT_1527780 [Mycena rebaudengoi]|nr:hypothetical protein C8J57DRAFT_1527780 [Mycena rebaudengoi]
MFPTSASQNFKCNLPARAPVVILSTKKASSAADDLQPHIQFPRSFGVSPPPSAAYAMCRHRSTAPLQCVTRLLTQCLMYCSTTTSPQTRYVVPTALLHPHTLSAPFSPSRAVSRARSPCDAGFHPRRNHFRRVIAQFDSLPILPRESKPAHRTPRITKRTTNHAVPHSIASLRAPSLVSKNHLACHPSSLA